MYQSAFSGAGLEMHGSRRSWPDRAVFAVAVLVPGVLGGIPGLANFLVLPWMAEYRASRTTVIFLIELGMLAMYLVTPLLGRVLLKVQPWVVMLCGALIASAGLLAASAGPTLGVTAAGYIAAHALGLGLCGLLTSQTIVVRRFPDRLGKVSGAQTVALAAMNVILPLVIAPQIVRHGWRPVVAGCAITLLVTLPILIVLFLREKRGSVAAAAVTGQQPDHSAIDPASIPTTLQILAMPAFWLLVAAVIPIAIVAQSLAVNIIPFFAERGVGAQQASYVLAGIGAASAVGAVAIGAVVDRASPALVMAAIAAVSMLGLSAVALRIGPPAIPLVVMFLGLAGMAPTLFVGVRRLFGNAVYSPIAGLVGPFLLISAFSGAGAGWLRDRLGTYQSVFAILAALMFLSLIASLALARRPLAEP